MTIDRGHDQPVIGNKNYKRPPNLLIDHLDRLASARSQVIYVRLREETYLLLKDLSGEYGLTVSSLVRLCVERQLQALE